MIDIKLEAKTLEELELKMSEYEASFPSAGYGTSFKKPYQDPHLGTWFVRGSRGATCD